MKPKNRYSIIPLIVVACLTSLAIQAAPRSTPVTVVNDSATPIPVTGAVEVTGAVTVDNGPANPITVVIPDPVQVNMGTNYRYVGWSNTTTAATIGLNQMNDICSADYGPEARMCTTEEFYRTPSIPAVGTGPHWILPVIVNEYHDPVSNIAYRTDYTGYVFTDTGYRSITCNSYPPIAGATGVVNWHGIAHFQHVSPYQKSCNSVYPVDCCAPQ